MRDPAVGEVRARRAERVLDRLDVEQLALRVPQRRGPLDQHVPQRRARTSGSARSTSRQSRPRPAPASITTNGSGSPSCAPPPVERPGDARAEQRTDLGAGDEVAAGPARRRARGEEPGLRVVERGLDERAERDRPGPVDPLRRAAGSLAGQPPAASSPIRAKTCGYTPTTSTIAAQMPIAALSANGMRSAVGSTVSGHRVEPHLPDDAHVVEERDHRLDRGDHAEHGRARACPRRAPTGTSRTWRTSPRAAGARRATAGRRVISTASPGAYDPSPA